LPPYIDSICVCFGESRKRIGSKDESIFIINKRPNTKNKNQSIIHDQQETERQR